MDQGIVYRKVSSEKNFLVAFSDADFIGNIDDHQLFKEHRVSEQMKKFAEEIKTRQKWNIGSTSSKPTPVATPAKQLSNSHPTKVHNAKHKNHSKTKPNVQPFFQCQDNKSYTIRKGRMATSHFF